MLIHSVYILGKVFRLDRKYFDVIYKGKKQVLMIHILIYMQIQIRSI